jgi:hypothetical protein
MRKPSLCLAHDRKARLGGFGERRLVDEETGGAFAAAADAPSQLMELGKAKALGMLDHHHGRFRDIDADLDHGRGDQEPRLAGSEALHGAVLVGAFHAAVHEIDHGAEMLLKRRETVFGGGKVAVLGFFDQRTDPIDATAFRQRAADRVDHLGEPVERNRPGIDRLAAGRFSRSSDASMSPK